MMKTRETHLAARLGASLISVLSVAFFIPSVASAALTIDPSSLPNAQVGVRYTQTLTNNYDSAFTWARTGDLPPGLTGTPTPDNKRYTIDGYPTGGGTNNFTIRLSPIGSADVISTRSYSLVTDVIPPSGVPLEIYNTSPLPSGRVGVAYNLDLLAIGGNIPYRWSISYGSTLPPGMTISTAADSRGTLGGTPTTAGTYTFSVKLLDFYENSITQTFSITIASPLTFVTPPSITDLILPVAPVVTTPSITTTSVPSGRVGGAYSTTLTGTSGTVPYRWSVSYGSTLPPGLSLSSSGDSGIISGSPTLAGTYSFDIKLLDASERSSTRSFTMTVASSSALIIPPTITLPSTLLPTALAISTTSLPTGTVNAAYSTNLGATGGTSPYRWNFASGNLPPGLTLAANGVLSGTPTTPGTYTSYLEVFDHVSAYVGRSFTVTILSAPTTPASSPAPSSGIIAPTTFPSTPELTNRLNNLNRMGVSIHALVKLPDDGNRFTQADSAVYYIGGDGRRHAFPNDRVYFTWYSNFNSVRVVSASDLASIPLGANATYRPGIKMVKFATDPKVYAITGNRGLRWIKTESVATALYGSNWNRLIDDIADTYYLDYTFGAEINNASDYPLTAIRDAARYVSDTLPL